MLFPSWIWGREDLHDHAVPWVFGSHHPVKHQTTLGVVWQISVSAAPPKKSAPKLFLVCLFFFIKLKLFHLLTSRWSSICFLQTRFLQLPKQIQIVQRTAASLLTGRCEREHIVLIFSVLHSLAWFVMIRDFSVNSLSSTRTRPQNTFRPCNLNFLVVVQVISSSAEELGVFNLLVTIRHCKGRKMAGHPSLLLLLTSERKKNHFRETSGSSSSSTLLHLFPLDTDVTKSKIRCCHANRM